MMVMMVMLVDCVFVVFFLGAPSFGESRNFVVNFFLRGVFLMANGFFFGMGLMMW